MILNFSVPGGANIGYNKACLQSCIPDIHTQDHYEGMLNYGKGYLVYNILVLLLPSVYSLLYWLIPFDMDS